MSNSNHSSRSTVFDRLSRRLERFSPSLEYANALKQAAQEILADNPIGSEASSDEIGESIRSLLPPPQIVFTKEYFSQPVFPVALIKDVASLYGCLQISEEILSEIDEEKRADSAAMTNAWLAHAYHPVLERVLLVLDMYETERIFGPLSLTLPLSPQPRRGNNTRNTTTPAPENMRIETRTEERQASLSMQPSDARVPGISRAAGPTQNIGSNSDTPDKQAHGHGPKPSVGDPTKKAAAVEQYFRSSKYSGDLSQSLQNTIRDYNVCAMQLELTPHQRTLFFINVFGGTARDYFFEHCREDMSYEQLVDVMKKGFDNNARQLAIEAELENLTLEKVMKDYEISDVNQGLTKLTDKINSLFPQMPMQSQYPKNKVRFLRKAVLEQDWAKASIAQIVTADFGFDDLLTSLREQYQLEREVQEAKSKSSPSLSTLYQQYGRRPSKFNRNGRSKFRSGHAGQKRLNPIGRDGKRMACSLCGSHEHFARECPPGALRNSVRFKLEKGISAIHICHDLVKGIEELPPEVFTDDADEVEPDDYRRSDDTPSELHIFDKLSGKDAQDDEDKMVDSAETIFFDKVDESIAINFITSKFAEKDTASQLQPITGAKLAESGFQTDV